MKSKNDIFSQHLEGLPHFSENLETLFHLQSLGKTLPLFQQIQSDDLLSELAPVAAHFQTFEDILILGTGGSSLGGQTLLALRNPNAQIPRLHFLDNIDPYTFHVLLSKLNIKKTGAIAISKSGNTAETITQLLLCIQHWLQSIPEVQLTDHFQIITEPVDNGIRRLANAYALPCLEHPSDIGGRFAVFTVVGMLPALIAGLDAKAIRSGAREVLRVALDAKDINDCPALQGAALHISLATSGISQTVLMPYVDRLNTFTLWFRQLWAESLGKLDANKQRQGITPVQALGTVDQHSQLQLYLDGPRDKFFTIITLDHTYDSVKITLPTVGHAAIDLFQNKTMGDLMMAEQQATIDTLRKNKCPTRVFHLTSLEERTLGGLMMHYILETLATAHLLNVNPFDQPAVEEGKILTKAYLENAA